MVIIGDNLKALIEQHKIVVDSVNSFDDTSICLRLDSIIIKVKPTDDSVINYGSEIPSTWINQETIDTGNGVILEPRQSILACSAEIVKIPMGYFGLLQTKGSLARLFISLHCSDSQIEPGYYGKITFEICNFSDMRVRLLPGQIVGDLFILKASTKHVKAYAGKYQGADKPTIQIP